MSNQNRKPLFANVLNLPWKVSKADESVIVDVNGDIVLTVGLNIFPELAADEEACAERAKLLVEKTNVGALPTELRLLNVGDVLGSSNPDVPDHRIVGMGKDLAGKDIVITSTVEGNTKVEHSVDWLAYFLSTGMIVVR